MAFEPSNLPSSDVVADNGSFPQNVHPRKVIKNALGTRINLALKHRICIDDYPRKFNANFIKRLKREEFIT